MTDAAELPSARQALLIAVQNAQNYRFDAATVWLGIARELREGAPAQPVRHIFDPRQIADMAAAALPADGKSIDRTATIPAQQEATEVIHTAGLLDDTCPACGERTFLERGERVHRATYRKECSPMFTAAGAR